MKVVDGKLQFLDIELLSQGRGRGVKERVAPCGNEWHLVSRRGGGGGSTWSDGE